MQFDNLGVIERKVLGALLIMAREDNTVKTTYSKIAQTIGYKNAGGALSFAIKILERDNFIVKLDNGSYKLLV
jgi:hypothetical protein